MVCLLHHSLELGANKLQVTRVVFPLMSNMKAVILPAEASFVSCSSLVMIECVL